jgi:hypothetical protein
MADCPIQCFNVITAGWIDTAFDGPNDITLFSTKWGNGKVMIGIPPFRFIPKNTRESILFRIDISQLHAPFDLKNFNHDGQVMENMSCAFRLENNSIYLEITIINKTEWDYFTISYL